MVRIPLIKMCSRETERLPAAEVNKILQTAGLPLEVKDMPRPSGIFFIYHENSVERDCIIHNHFFRLVEVVGQYQERIILEGPAIDITFYLGGQCITFECERTKIGKYKFYCPFFEKVKK